MPITKSAKKALRRSKRRTKINKRRKEVVKKAIKTFRKSLTPETLRKAYSAIDTAAKKKIFHKNKAKRLKSQLAKLLNAKKKTSSPTSKKKRREK